MATAAGLNAVSSILNSQGLGVSPALLSALSTYRSKPALDAFANIYLNAGISPTQTSNIVSQLNTIGSTITSGHFLLDLYPGNITPTCSAGITAWTANTVIAVGNLISNNGKIYTTTGNVFSSSFDGNVINNCTLTGFSGVIEKQAQLPFVGATYSRFANVFTTVYGFQNQVFDTVSSTAILKNKTYSESGVGVTGPAELITGGIGNAGALLANVVANFGTMYDINNFTKIGDPYVFGQNLINQGLGYVNGLSDQLTNVGLDITQLPDVPAVKTETTQEDTYVTVSSFVGEVALPSLTETTTTTPVTGNSPTVVTNIYKTITGSNLQVIVDATGITSLNSSERIKTLADYLNINAVVDESLLPELRSIGVTDFSSLGTYLGTKVGQGRFTSWSGMADFFNSLEVPTLSHLPTGADSNILYSSAVTTLNNRYGTGTGSLGNPLIIDYLGACAGDPYTPLFGIINSNYDSLIGSIDDALADLDQAVIDYSNAYNAYLASEIPDSAIPPAPPVGDGVPPDPGLLLPFTIITSNVAAVNSALSSLPDTAEVSACNRAVYQMLDHLASEVGSLQKAGVTFDSGNTQSLNSFAESIGQLGSDKTQIQTYQFFANIISDNLAGDTIRAAIAEVINGRLLNGAGIQSFNDPDPRAKIYQSQAQNVPLSTYITQNK